MRRQEGVRNLCVFNDPIESTRQEGGREGGWEGGRVGGSTSHASSATISLKGRVGVTGVNHAVNAVLAVR